MDKEFRPVTASYSLKEICQFKQKVWWKISLVKIADQKLLSKLTSFGLVSGNYIKLHQAALFTDPIVYRVGEVHDFCLISLRRDEIEGITVVAGENNPD